VSSAGLQALPPLHSKTSTLLLLIEADGKLAYINTYAIIRHDDKMMTTFLINILL